MTDYNEPDNLGPMSPHEFLKHLHKVHYLTKQDEMLLDLNMIDALVEHMGDDLPDAEYIVKRIQKRLNNDLKY